MSKVKENLVVKLLDRVEQALDSNGPVDVSDLREELEAEKVDSAVMERVNRVVEKAAAAPAVAPTGPAVQHESYEQYEARRGMSNTGLSADKSIARQSVDQQQEQQDEENGQTESGQGAENAPADDGTVQIDGKTYDADGNLIEGGESNR